MRYWTIFAIALFAGTQAEARATSGRFESVDLAVTGTAVVGSFREASDTGSCAFTFRGSVDGAGRGSIMASDGNAAPRRGSIAADAGHVNLTIPGARGFAGCSMILMPEIDQGVDFSHTADTAWTSLMRIVGARVALRPTPSAVPGRAYVVRDDIVGVTGRRPGWFLVVFRNDVGRESRGWVAANELAPVPPAG